jgi:uncharacterized protein YbdZ (MbtH family)
LLIAAGLITASTSGCGGGFTPALRVVGNKLVDAENQPIRVLGVNRSGSEYACVQRWGFFDGPTDKRAIAQMLAWRINAVRLPLNEDCWLGINGVPARYNGTRYRAAIKAFVRRLRRAGLFVILDLHWNAPGAEPATGQEAMADLDHAPTFWSSVAGAFKADTGVMFDLYNEPQGISWQCWRDGCLLPQGWRTAGMQTLVDAVRSTGARQPIIATGIDSGHNLSAWLSYRPRDPDAELVAGFHAYSFTGCVTLTCWTQEIGVVARRVPVVTTELGEGGCSHAFIDRYMNWADSTGVSYLGWTWNTSGCGAPALISSWTGEPTAYGAGLRRHLLKLGGDFRPQPALKSRG